MNRIARLSVLLAVTVTPILGAQAPKKVLTQSDWDRWRSIQGATLSNDGRWAAYTLSPQVGDGEFVVRSTTGATEYRVPVGYIGRPNNTPGGARAGAGGGGRAGGAGGAGAAGPFSADGRFAFVTTQPNKEEVERAQRASAGRAGRAGGTGAAAPASRTALVIIDLANGNQTTLPDVRSYRLPRESGKWMVYAPSNDSTARSPGDSGATPPGAGAGQGAAIRGGRTPQGPRRSYGSTIMLRNLESSADERLTDVASYTFDDSAKVLAYTVISRDSTRDGVYLRDLTTGATRTVMAGQGNYRGFTFDRLQQQYAFLSDRDEFGKPDARLTIYHGTLRTGTAAPVVAPNVLPEGMRLPETASVSFSRNANALLFAIAPPPEDTIPADSLAGKAVFDLWHYRDPDLQPTQKLRVNQDRNRSYQALYTFATRKVVQLGSDTITSVNLSDDLKTGVATSSLRYQIEKMWGDDGNDVYVVDPGTGTRRLIAEKISGAATLSPDARYILYFDRGHWFSHQLANGRTTNVTAPARGVRFDQETWNTPSTPSAWGIAGWTKGDRSVLLYDRFDIWEIDPTGTRPAVVVTDSVGRRENMTFRVVSLDRDPDERAIDPAKPLTLRAFDEDTKSSGFYRDRLGVRAEPERIVMDDVAYGTPQKARDADMYLVTRSTTIDFPNLWVGPSLTSLARISDANPWQSEYNWVTSELVSWVSSDGKPLQGILYKPENFDPSRKYPLISYFYEDLSDGRHNYVVPTGRNVINATHYASNGYLVFLPDIYYEDGYPGPSAMKSIVPGVQMLLARGYVDPKGLGLQGQSWGGYQASYMITQTGMFSAAMAGAPVANMTSAYGGIRWGSGVARAFQYETGQSRIGKSLWEAPFRYIENSPLFWLDKVSTPLFIMHNDQDDAVPWYQGIEMFVGLRRLGKEVYLINYNNDVHNPASRANQKDVAMRMQQFFDAKLKGAPAPDWMVRGIPAREKGRDQVAPPGTIRP